MADTWLSFVRSSEISWVHLRVQRTWHWTRQMSYPKDAVSSCFRTKRFVPPGKDLQAEGCSWWCSLPKGSSPWAEPTSKDQPRSPCINPKGPLARLDAIYVIQFLFLPHSLSQPKGLFLKLCMQISISQEVTFHRTLNTEWILMNKMRVQN